ncbi:MAG: glycosyltransferase family 4 protein [Deltaproteobacteria bacterium]|nr:glycosyltransferase family 4 protein [Deltaproteobacteria bacterium]
MYKTNNRRFNILYFSSFGGMKGGGQRSLYYLVAGLNKNIFNPIVVCPDEGELVDSLKEIGIETMVIPSKRFRHLSIVFIIKLLRLFKEKNIAIVHTDAVADTFYAGIAALFYRIPLIWHIRVSSSMFMDRFLSLLSTRFILVAKALENRFYWLKSTNKLVTIHNGISVEEFDRFPITNIRDEFKIDTGSIVIGCIGRIEEMKGQEYLIKAMSKVVEARRDIRVLLVGEADKKYKEYIMDLIETYRLNNYFSFTGYRKDTLGILNGVDILVSSSSFAEGLSRVILEAMAAGKPVIATDVGGARETITDGINGLVVPPKDEKALSSAILNILNNSEKRQEIGIAGRHIVERDFSIRNNIEKTERLYLEILNAN